MSDDADTGHAEIDRAEIDGAAQYVAMIVGDRAFGVDINAVSEIRQWSPATALPGQAPYTRGVMNLRGAIVPVHDLRARFGGGLTEATETSIVVIVMIAGRRVGILVDAVSGIRVVKTEEIAAAPDSAPEVDRDAVLGLVASDDDMIALLDLERVFAPVAA